MNAYDFCVKAQDGTEVALSQYAGKAMLIVNTATACGFTPQYDQLQDLYEECQAAGLEILDFPCNQFGAQAPGSNEEIHSFCSDRYGITFPQFAKVDVNGEHAIALYQWLTSASRFEGFGDTDTGRFMDNLLSQIDPDFRNNGAIKWNFTKFLVSKNGELLARFEPTADWSCVVSAVKEAL